MFKSVSKLPTHEITGGVLLNQKVTPAMLSNEENTKKLETIIRTFFNRLEGYSAFFNVLSKATQDDIIGRTEQSL